MRRALVILNPAAGRGAGARKARDVVAALESAGFTCTLRMTERPGDERVLARDASREGWETILVAGGDGTVHGVANGLVDVGNPRTALGVVPVGTGNDFVKGTGIPTSLRATALGLAHARIRRFDVGVVQGERFINGCGVGFGPAVLTAVQDMARLRGFSLYAAAAWRTFSRYVPVVTTVAWADQSITAPMTMVEIAIGTTAGGGFRLTPGAQPDDGLLDICVIRAISTLQFLRYVPRVIMGRHGHLPPVTLFQTDRVRVSVPGMGSLMHLDGELRSVHTDTLEVGLEAGRLPVLCAA
jgi:YegS/Rv2252/BmrU family lipid kinase